MRYRLRTLLIVMAVLAAFGVGLLLLECGLLMLPEDFLPFGIGGWLLEIFLFHYGIPVTLIFTLVALAAVAILVVVTLVQARGEST